MSFGSFIKGIFKPAAQSAVSRLWVEVKGQYPELVADIKKGIADATNTNLSGGEKAVKVAIDVLATAPDVIKALPNAKAFLVHAVTDTFAAGLHDLEAAAGLLLGKLGK